MVSDLGLSNVILNRQKQYQQDKKYGNRGTHIYMAP